MSAVTRPIRNDESGVKIRNKNMPVRGPGLKQLSTAAAPKTTGRGLERVHLALMWAKIRP